MKNLRISKANKRKSEPAVNLLALLDTQDTQIAKLPLLYFKIKFN